MTGSFPDAYEVEHFWKNKAGWLIDHVQKIFFREAYLCVCMRKGFTLLVNVKGVVSNISDSTFTSCKKVERKQKINFPTFS